MTVISFSFRFRVGSGKNSSTFYTRNARLACPFDVPERLVEWPWDAGGVPWRLVCKGLVSEHAYRMWQNDYYYGD
jgi:hypothetical protein